MAQRRFAILCVLACAVGLTLVPLARAASLSSSFGAEWARGPGEQETKAAIAVAGFDVPHGNVIAGALRYHDRIAGSGTGWVLGGSLSLWTPLALRAQGTYFQGDASFRAWRIKAGPQLSRGAAVAWISYLHDENSFDATTDAGVCELTVPIRGSWAGKLEGSYGRNAGEIGYASAAGLIWGPLAHFEITGQIGIARNPPATTEAPRLSGPLGLGLLGGPGGGERSSTTEGVATTSLLGARITFP